MVFREEPEVLNTWLFCSWDQLCYIVNLFKFWFAIYVAGSARPLQLERGAGPFSNQSLQDKRVQEKSSQCALWLGLPPLVLLPAFAGSMRALGPETSRDNQAAGLSQGQSRRWFNCSLPRLRSTLTLTLLLFPAVALSDVLALLLTQAHDGLVRELGSLNLTEF